MDARVQIRPARLVDVWAFGDMRPADALEVKASGGYEPVEAVMEAWAVSNETWTLRINGEVAAMFGVAPYSDDALTPVGIVWALTTKIVDRFPVTFYRLSRMVVKDLYNRHGTLINYVDARYAQALSWVRRIGFDVQPAVPFGQNGELFHPIAYEGRHV